MTSLKTGFVYYQKDGIINIVELPKFGELTLVAQNGEVVTTKKLVVEKH